MVVSFGERCREHSGEELFDAVDETGIVVDSRESPGREMKTGRFRLKKEKIDDTEGIDNVRMGLR